MRTVASLILPVTGIAFILLSFAGFPTRRAEKKPANYTGSNTLSYTINKETPIVLHSVAAEVSTSNGVSYLNILFGKGYENRVTFMLEDESLAEGTYSLNKAGSRYASFQNSTADCLFVTDEFYDGVLMIHHYDSAKRIIAGSFEFIAHSSMCDELIRVSDGSFDLPFIND